MQVAYSGLAAKELGLAADNGLRADTEVLVEQQAAAAEQ